MPDNKDDLLLKIRNGQPMTTREQLKLTWWLSLPAILAQLTTTVMQYIDASMVGSLGAEASAAIGLVETTTWMIGSLCSAGSAGFYVQVAHLLGAGRPRDARSVLRQAVSSMLLFGLIIGAVALSISPLLPRWLGGGDDIAATSSAYFAIFALCIPFFQFSMLGAGMLRSSGNMVVPSVLSVSMMAMDVVFNFFLIFPTRQIDILGTSLTMPGAGLGVKGAAIGTGLAEVITALLMMYFLCIRSRELGLRAEKGSFRPTRKCLKEAFRIGMPMGVQQMIMNSAYIVITIIIAPLGTVALAANSLGIVIESLCYMPGYGISDAATTLVGQSMGAGRKNLMRRFAYMAVAMGMTVMAVMGVVMYVTAPYTMAMLTPVAEVRELGTTVLRIEAFAEPMFAAAIVCYGAFVGASDTLMPSGMNLLSMWGVRITLAALLAPRMGLRGVWLAMCIELCFRGLIFLARLKWGKWEKKAYRQT